MRPYFPVVTTQLAERISPTCRKGQGKPLDPGPGPRHERIMIVLDAQAIEARTDPAELIGVIGRAFAGETQVPARGHHALGPTADDGTLLVMPAWRTGEAIGVKIATVMPRNASLGRPTVDGLYVLLDAGGSPRALLDAKALTLARTAAVSAFAASLLARADAATLLMVGTGALAPHLIRAHAAVRAYDRVLIWGRSLDKAAALAARLRGEGFEAHPASELDAAVREADVISCATLSTEPLVHGADLKAGAHLDLVGGFTPQMREADDESVRRASVFVDTPTALAEAGDLSQPIGSRVLDAASVVELSALARAGGRERAPGEITLFKAVGTALADLAAAEYFVGRDTAA